MSYFDRSVCKDSRRTPFFCQASNLGRTFTATWALCELLRENASPYVIAEKRQTVLVGSCCVGAVLLSVSNLSSDKEGAEYSGK